MIAAGLCLVGAVAYACTTGSGEATNVSPTSGTANSSLLVQTYTTGSGLAVGTYSFRYAYQGDLTACHHETAIGNSVAVSSGGHIASATSPLPRTIPNLGPRGNGQACWSTAKHTTSEIASSATITVN